MNTKNWGAAEYAAIILDYPFDHPNIEKIRRKEKIRMEKRKIDKILEDFVEDKEKTKFQILVDKNLENLEKCRDDKEHICFSYSHVEPLKTVWGDKQVKVTIFMTFRDYIYELLKLNNAGIYLDNVRDLLFYDELLENKNEFYNEDGTPNKEYEKVMEAKICMAKQKNEQNKKFAAFDVEIIQLKAGYSLIQTKDIHWRRKKYIDIRSDEDAFIDNDFADFIIDSKAVIESERLLDLVGEGLVYITNPKFMDYHLFHELCDKEKIDRLFEYYKKDTLI